MSTLKMFAIRDNKVSAYGRPFCEQNEILASRALSVAVKDTATQLSHFPEDFDLYLLGEFDDISGVLTPETPPKFVVGAVSLKKLAESRDSLVAELETKSKLAMAKTERQTEVNHAIRS